MGISYFTLAFRKPTEEEAATKNTKKEPQLGEVENQERILPRNQEKDISRWQEW